MVAGERERYLCTAGTSYCYRILIGDRVEIETRLNGTVVQSGHFSELLFDPTVIVSYVSQYVTLFPGDVIYSGTPGDTAAMKPGDIIEIEIPGIGILRNRVVE